MPLDSLYVPESPESRYSPARAALHHPFPAPRVPFSLFVPQGHELLVHGALEASPMDPTQPSHSTAYGTSMSAGSLVKPFSLPSSLFKAIQLV